MAGIRIPNREIGVQADKDGFPIEFNGGRRRVFGGCRHHRAATQRNGTGRSGQGGRDGNRIDEQVDADHGHVDKVAEAHVVDKLKAELDGARGGRSFETLDGQVIGFVRGIGRQFQAAGDNGTGTGHLHHFGVEPGEADRLALASLGVDAEGIERPVLRQEGPGGLLLRIFNQISFKDAVVVGIRIEIQAKHGEIYLVAGIGVLDSLQGEGDVAGVDAEAQGLDGEIINRVIGAGGKNEAAGDIGAVLLHLHQLRAGPPQPQLLVLESGRLHPQRRDNAIGRQESAGGLFPCLVIGIHLAIAIQVGIQVEGRGIHVGDDPVVILHDVGMGHVAGVPVVEIDPVDLATFEGIGDEMEGCIAPQGTPLAVRQGRGRGPILGDDRHGRRIVHQDRHLPDPGFLPEVKLLVHLPVADGLHREKVAADLAGIVLLADCGPGTEGLAHIRVLPFQNLLVGIAEDEVPLRLRIRVVDQYLGQAKAAGQDGKQNHGGNKPMSLEFRDHSEAPFSDACLSLFLSRSFFSSSAISLPAP